MKVYEVLGPGERRLALEFLARVSRGALGVEVVNVLKTLVGVAASRPTQESLHTPLASSGALLPPTGPIYWAPGSGFPSST